MKILLLKKKYQPIDNFRVKTNCLSNSVFSVRTVCFANRSKLQQIQIKSNQQTKVHTLFFPMPFTVDYLTQALI